MTSERQIALTPERIVRLVKNAENARESLRTRFEEDYKRYQLEWSDDRWKGGVKPEGYDSYTSNEPRTFADRIIGLLTSAKLNAQIPMEGNLEEERAINETKEQFFLGALKYIDEIQRNRLMPKLREQLAFYVAIRGWYCGRALLVKTLDGHTEIMVDTFDPLHTYYGMGSEGLKWVCHVTKRTRDEIYDEYGLDLTGDSGEIGNDGARDPVGIDVYDFYDKTHNAVVTQDSWAKEPTEHLAGRVPCFIGYVGPIPQIVRKDTTSVVDNIEDVGESIFAANRAGYNQWNKTMSDVLTFVRRSLRQPIVYESADGTKTIGGDPWRTGAELAIAAGEKIRPLDLLHMAPDTDKFLGSMSGELQRGALPHTVYGEIQFQLSGYAINTLRQGLDLAIQNVLVAMQGAYGQIAALLCSQYATGMFAPIKMRGYNRERYFRQEIAPDDLAKVEDALEITLLPQLPTDDIAAYQMAEIAIKSGLLSPRTARDRILKLQNADQENLLIKEDVAEKSNPIAALISLINACLDRGRYDLAVVYFKELEAALALRGQLPEEYLPRGIGTRQPQPNAGGLPAGPTGVSSQVAPAQAQGVPQGRPVGTGAATGRQPPPLGATNGSQNGV